MITSLLLFIFGIIISAVVAILPRWTYPPDFINGLSFLLAGADSLNFLFPFYTLLQVFLTLLLFEASYYLAKLIAKLLLGSRVDI